MPNWLLPSVCMAALIGFIGYAFYQGTKVRLDRDNSDSGPNLNSGQSDGAHGGSDGHSGF
jgi:hypothetical protein